MFGNVSHGNAIFNGKADFVCHPSCDLIPEIPQLITLGKQRESGFETELSVFCIFIIEELCEINVRSDGNHPMLSCHVFAVAPSLTDVIFHRSAKCRTDIDFPHVSYLQSSHRR